MNNQKYLVLDSLAISLHNYPIHIPIPKNTKTEKQIITFTKKTIKNLMKLDIFEWYHNFKDIIIDGFTVRNNFIYPDIST